MHELTLRRIISLLSAVSILLVSLLTVSCARRLNISNEEAYEVLKKLVPESYEVNEILFGKGLATEESGAASENGTKYCRVVGGGGYSSIADIKKKAEAVYSKSYLKNVYVPTFEGVHAEGSDGSLDFTISPRYKEIGGELYADVSYAPHDIRGQLEVISCKVTQKEVKYVKLEMTYSQDGTQGTMLVFLTLQDGVWLLDGPTY